MEINIFMIIGFLTAGYAIVANDAIQTLGTFLSSNSHRPWWVLWLYACSILVAVLLIGYFTADGVAYGRLEKIPIQPITWMHVIPPIVLLILTRFGFPVSTTFLILTFFAPKRLDDMLVKSLSGYVVAFIAAFILFRLITGKLEIKFIKSNSNSPHKLWYVAQWISTGFLWSQWLIQDLANIYVYLPRELPLTWLFGSMVVLLILHAYTFYTHGGEIQKIVTSKTNTTDIRSATFIDLIFGLVLLAFKEWSKIPMSTTWVFLGVLAGRELALTMAFRVRTGKSASNNILTDLAKAGAGLAVSVFLALVLPLLAFS